MSSSQRVFNFDRDAPLRRQRLAAIAERISAESLLDVEPRLDADTFTVPVSVDYDAFGMDEELTPEVMGRLEAAQRTKLRLRMHERLMRETHPHQDGHPVDYLVYFCCFPVWTIVLLVVVSSTDSASCDTPLHTYLFLRFMAYLSILVMMLTAGILGVMWPSDFMTKSADAIAAMLAPPTHTLVQSHMPFSIAESAHPQSPTSSAGSPASTGRHIVEDDPFKTEYEDEDTSGPAPGTTPVMARSRRSGVGAGLGLSPHIGRGSPSPGAALGGGLGTVDEEKGVTFGDVKPSPAPSPPGGARRRGGIIGVSSGHVTPSSGAGAGAGAGAGTGAGARAGRRHSDDSSSSDDDGSGSAANSSDGDTKAEPGSDRNDTMALVSIPTVLVSESLNLVAGAADLIVSRATKAANISTSIMAQGQHHYEQSEAKAAGGQTQVEDDALARELEKELEKVNMPRAVNNRMWLTFARPVLLMHGLFYIAWSITGWVWIASADTCSTTSPSLYYTSVVDAAPILVSVVFCAWDWLER